MIECVQNIEAKGASGKGAGTCGNPWGRDSCGLISPIAGLVRHLSTRQIGGNIDPSGTALEAYAE